MMWAIFVNILGMTIVMLTLLSQVELWQRKEYRLDRLRAYLRDTAVNQYASILFVALFMIAGGWTMFIYGDDISASAFGLSALSILTVYHVMKIKQRGIYRPCFTPKAILIGTLAGLGLIIPIIYVLTFQIVISVQWTTIILLAPIVTAFSVGFVNIVTHIRKRKMIAAATRLRHDQKNLVVVGITGSFGKTSTKFFLHQILSYVGCSHLVTPKRLNSVFPVAQHMLKSLSSQTEIYVVEMGAYRRGEIAELVQLTQPQIGAITAMGNQHLELFGTQEKLVQAKWELVAGLPADGIAVLNADDQRIRKMARHEKRRIVWYSAQKPADVYITHLQFLSKEISCQLHIRRETFKVIIPLLGEGSLMSVLSACALALSLGLQPKDIAEALHTLKPVPKTMELRSAIRGATIIDDSYSANAASVQDAINHLSRFPQQSKIVVLMPLIELGSAAATTHRQIGQQIARSGLKAIVAGVNYRHDIMAGFATIKESKATISFISNPNKLQAKLIAMLHPDTVMLLAGRLPKSVRRAVLR